MVFENLVHNFSAKLIKSNFKNGILLHGGGWKKLEKLKISNNLFKKKLFEKLKLVNIYNYYGMVEQAGTIFMECAHGNLHAADNSDVIIRDPETHVPLPHGVRGLVQVFSGIQKSYPGHSLLTEDIGVTQPAHSCPCGHQGTVIEIYGRLKKAEVRGCSDAYT